MTWHRGMLCAFDTETSGLDVEKDCIVTACVALIDGSGKVAPKVMSWMAKPSVDIHPKATETHHITTEYAREHGAEPALVVAEILAELHTAQETGIPLVIVNAPFDLTLLDRECRRYELPTLDRLLGRPIGPVVDPQVLDKHADKWRSGKRTLTALCEHYKVRLDGAHDASFDAVAGARVAWRIAEKYQYGEMPLNVLHGMQVEAKRSQDLSFAAYLRKQAGRAKTADEQIELNQRADSCTGHWPLMPYAAAVSA